VLKKPRMLKNDRFILNYFLGELSDERKNEIYRFAQENNCEVINILDKNSKFYACGPSEFLYLEKNAFLICTDSFHSSVFAILYKRPLLIFERENKGWTSMNSRLETLTQKFGLDKQCFKGRISDESIECNYNEVDEILENERKKFEAYINKAVN